MQKINGIYRQKGVDTLLNTELFKVAQRKQFRNIIIVTADTDFVPLIQEISKNYGVDIILAYYTDRKRSSPFSMSNYLWQACPNKILIEREDFFVPEKRKS